MKVHWNDHSQLNGKIKNLPNHQPETVHLRGHVKSCEVRFGMWNMIHQLKKTIQFCHFTLGIFGEINHPSLSPWVWKTPNVQQIWDDTETIYLVYVHQKPAKLVADSKGEIATETPVQASVYPQVKSFGSTLEWVSIQHIVKCRIYIYICIYVYIYICVYI